MLERPSAHSSALAELLRTKLASPRLPSALVVPRPWLLDRLEAGLARKLTLVAAPADLGNSTLLAERRAATARRAATLTRLKRRWAAAAGRRCGWEAASISAPAAASMCAM